MSKYSIDNTTLTAIADAIREKGGTSDPILTEGMAAAIAAIEAKQYASGTFIPNEDTFEIEIHHNLKRMPEGAVVFNPVVVNESYTMLYDDGKRRSTTYCHGYYLNGTSGKTHDNSTLYKEKCSDATASGGGIYKANEETIHAGNNRKETLLYFLSAVEYFWIVW